MAFQVSPGVNVTEQDLTLGVRGVSTSKGAFAGFFNWGPVEQRVLVSSEDNLVKRFSKPDGTNAAYWFSAANFLSYANALEVVRHINGALNATSSGVGKLIKNEDDYDAKVGTDTNAFIAKYPGSLGNGLIVSIADRTTFLSSWDYSGAFDSAPAAGGDEVHVVVVDGDGTWSGTQGLVLERYPFLSLIEGTRSEDGSNIYIKDAINSRSSYVWVGGEFQLANDSAQEDFLSQAISVTEETFTINSETFVEPADITAGAGVEITLANDISGFNVVVTRQPLAGAEVILTEGADYVITLGTFPSADTITVNTVNSQDTIRVYILSDAAITWDPIAGATIDLATDVDGLNVVVTKNDGVSEVALTEGALDDYVITLNASPTADQLGIKAASFDVGDEIKVYILDNVDVDVVTAEDLDEDDAIVVKQGTTTLAEGDDYSIDYGSNTISVSQYGLNVTLDPFTNLATGIDISVISGGSDEYILSGGENDNDTNANRNSSYLLWNNAEESDISLIITGPANQAELLDIVAMAERRKDAVVFISPLFGDVVNNSGNEAEDIVSFRDTLNINSSYAFLDGNWKYQYDRYNDVYRWVPCNGDVAGLAANTDSVADPWFSIAGYTRGLIRNVIRLAWNPDKASRDELYKSGINPIITEAGEGTLLYGDKTLLSRPSAFDRINVRRLFIVLEKAIARSAKFQLFEFNDEFTRAQFRNIVEPFLRDVQGRRGVYDFRVICDESNNTPEVIDRNEFVGDIYIKPARSINFIQLNFVAVRTGVDFEEIIGG